MNEIGWRTVVIDKAENLTITDSQMKVSGKETVYLIPISQIKDIIIANPYCSMTVPLINSLVANRVNIVICDEKKNPNANILSISNHSNISGNLFHQLDWAEETKANIWQDVVINKIANQIMALKHCGIDVSAPMHKYMQNVLPADTTYRESQAARVYFQALFGKNFIRHHGGNINFALDYGYTILRTSISRIVAMHGYNDAFGIHHKSKSNPYNLSCDIMESFRPMIDMIVFPNKDRELDWKYKSELIGVLQKNILYKGREMELSAAIDSYFLDIVKALNNGKQFSSEVICA